MCIRHTGKGSNPKALQAALDTLQRAGQLMQVGGQYKLRASTDVICDCAEQLIEKQGFATTLQIKETLRLQGFFVKQHEISNTMTQFEQEGNVQVTNVETHGKQHRLFFDLGTPEAIAVAAYYTTVN
jgi:hypothetical protein